MLYLNDILKYIYIYLPKKYMISWKSIKIKGIAFLKAILVLGILRLLNVQFADEKVARSTRNIYIYDLIERKPIAIKKCTIQKEYESRRDQKGRETTSTTTEKEVTDTGQDPKTLEKQKHTISRLLGGLPAKLGIVFFVFRMCLCFFVFLRSPRCLAAASIQIH